MISPPTCASRSSFVVPALSDTGRLLRDLARVLREGRRRWYVFGAQAVIAHGLPRATADVDVTLKLDPEDPAHFVDEMKKAGFDLRVDDPDDFIRRTRVLPFVHGATAMPLDVVLAGAGLEDQFLERAVEIDFEGERIPVISASDLVVAKILAGRAKDLEDVRNLLRTQGSRLELQRIRSVLGQLEEGLGQSDLLPSFERLLAGGSGPSRLR